MIFQMLQSNNISYVFLFYTLAVLKKGGKRGKSSTGKIKPNIFGFHPNSPWPCHFIPFSSVNSSQMQDDTYLSPTSITKMVCCDKLKPIRYFEALAQIHNILNKSEIFA